MVMNRFSAAMKKFAEYFHDAFARRLLPALAGDFVHEERPRLKKLHNQHPQEHHGSARKCEDVSEHHKSLLGPAAKPPTKT